MDLNTATRQNPGFAQCNCAFAATSLVWLLLGVAGLGIGPVLDAAEARSIKPRGLLLVANKGDRTLGIVDPVAGRQVAAVPEDGITGHEVAASSDGKLAFVPIYGNSGVGGPGTDGRLLRVIDLVKRQVAGTVDFGKGVRPHCAVMGPRNGLLYVTTELENSVTVIDPSTLRIVQTIPTGQSESHMLAVTRDGRRGYTSNVGPGTVSVVDLEAKKVLAVIAISGRTQRICLSVDDRWVFTADQTRPQLAVIETGINQVKTWVALPGLGYGTAPTPDGRWLLVALPGVRQVAVIDLDLLKVVRTLAVPPAPQEVLVQPDGATAYVSCDAAGQVAVIDLRNWKLEKLIAVGHGADGLAWAKAD
ncbi:MAG: YncE family protein [Verrucomicrobiota bacterium]|jgi:YVTN family beta-propeller protein